MKYEMGTTYFKLDDTPKSYEELNNFFVNLGLIAKEDFMGSDELIRQVHFTNNNGLDFSVIWYINLAHIRVGEWGKGFIQNSFTSIRGSYIPNCDHITLDFMDEGKRTLVLSIPEEEK